MTGVEVATAADEPVAVASPAPIAFLQTALTQGADVSTMKELVGLANDIRKEQARIAMAEAFYRFQGQASAVAKTRTAKIATKSGSTWSYDFAPLSEIADAIRDALHANGLSYYWTRGQVEGRESSICILEHVGGHSRQASHPIIELDQKNKAHADAAGESYARRYALTGVLAITTADVDTDANPDQLTGDPITEEQAATLTEWMETAKADPAKFCTFLGVPDIYSLDRSRFDEALRALKAKAGA